MAFMLSLMLFFGWALRALLALALSSGADLPPAGLCYEALSVTMHFIGITIVL
ncbi:hypothetical protein KCP69_10235 [Salmonella enterica subsp. enterica]|nr:hypothetical protein KCP69_10235 [Salmonella enterica subsp. enterica]